MWLYIIATGLALVMALPTAAAGQAEQTGQESAATWRHLAERLEAGTPVKARLRGGQQVKATFVEARPTELVIVPKTRVPVPPQAVRYEDILFLERDVPGGVNVGKAVAIGAASGAAAFVGFLLILLAASFD